MRDTLARYEEIKNAADCFQFTDHCFILSRGVFYPMALEAALKLQETNYMNGARPVHCRLFPRPARHGAAEYARRLLRAH